MTDIEKAHYAARVFSEKKYKGKSRWTVQETTKTFYGDGDLLDQQQQEETLVDVLVIGNPLQRYDPTEAYAIAKFLENEQQ